MALRNIREMGEEVLNKICKPVKEMTPRTKELIEDIDFIPNLQQHIINIATQIVINKGVIRIFLGLKVFS